jgi:hypothetical protein
MFMVIDGRTKKAAINHYLIWEVLAMHPFISYKKQKLLKRNKQKILNSTPGPSQKLTSNISQPDNPIFNSYPSEKMYQLNHLKGKDYEDSDY